MDGKGRILLPATIAALGRAMPFVRHELAPAEGDRVRLTITHSRLASRSSMLSGSGGWHTHIGVLVDRLAGRTPRPFWSSFQRMKQAYEPVVAAAWR